MNNKKHLHRLHFHTEDEMYQYVQDVKISQDDIVKMNSQSCILVYWGC